MSLIFNSTLYRKTGKRKSTCAYSIRSLWAKLIWQTKFSRSLKLYTSQTKPEKSFLLWILKKVKLTCRELFYFRIAIVHHFLEGKSFPAGHPLSRPPSVMDARRLNRQYYYTSVEEDRRDCVVCARVVSGQKHEHKLQEQDKHSVHHLWPQPLCREIAGKAVLIGGVLALGMPSFS